MATSLMPSTQERSAHSRAHPGSVESGCALDSLSLRMSYSENRFPLFRDHALATRQLVAHHHAALHHELHAFHLAQVRDRVAGHRNDVGELALFDGADVVLPAVVQHLR